MKNRLLAFFLVLVMCMPMMAYAEDTFTPGTYEASAQGFSSAVKVTMTFDAGNVTEVSIDAAGETPNIGGAAAEILAEAIKTNNGETLDSVSGATFTSNAVKEAMDSCVAQAKGAELSTQPVHFTAGTYTGSAQGMWDELTVEVTVTEDAITKVEVINHADTKVIANAAIAEMPARIVEKQSLAVDATSGATITSNGILAAAKNALSQATDDLSPLTAVLLAVEKTVLPDENYDIVIVGGGGAGMAAAVQAARISDCSVLVLEKEAYVGGSTALSGGGIMVAGTPKNQGEGIAYIIVQNHPEITEPLNCTPEEGLAYYVHKTENLKYRPDDMWINEALVKRIFEQSGKFYPYLMEQGLEQELMVGPGVIDAEKRIGIAGVLKLEMGDSVGDVFSTWFSDLATKNGAEVRVNAKVTSLVGEGNTVTGVMVETPDSTYQVNAKKVILCTGGFSRNRELIQETGSMFVNIDKVWPVAAPGTTGDALEMIKPFDGATTGYGMIMNFGVSEPYGYRSDIGNLTGLGTGYTAMQIDDQGLRYTTESNWYYDKCDDMLNHPSEKFYVVMNLSSDSELAAIAKAVDKGFAVEASTVQELAEKLNISVENLSASVEAYNVDGDHPISEESTIYALQLEPTVLDTFYGVKQDEQFHVLNSKGEPIENLFAAGLVGGGNYMLEKYYATTNAIGIAVYGGSLAAEEVVSAIGGAN